MKLFKIINMKKSVILKTMYLLSLIITVGCGRDNDNHDKPLGTIFQTQWEGTLSNIDSVYDITLSFNHETSGYYIIKNDSYGFSYYKNDKIIQISGYNGNLLNGEWMIVKLSKGQFILLRQPFIEAQRYKLNLSIIN